MEQLATILTYAVIGMVILIVILLLIWLGMSLKHKEKGKKESKLPEKDLKPLSTPNKAYEKQSILNFMEFDTIDDNMIIQKDGSRFLMIIECQGINYDLMSGVEKTSVEEGFIQFLNTLRSPIQIYIQTRAVNLESSIYKYKEKLKKIETKLNIMKIQYHDMEESGAYTREQKDKAFFELTKQSNLYEYGKDIIKDTERMSFNKNVLTQKYYIVIPYYASELGSEELDKEEIKNLAFSEVYTRAQSLIGSLMSCGVRGKILKTNELIELLYMAYNRDEAEVFGIDKAIQAGYNEINSTAPDVLDKKMKEINKYIEEKAMEKAKESVNQVISEKAQKVENREKNMDKIIKQMAEAILKENEASIGTDIMQKAIEKVQMENIKKIKERQGGGRDGEK